jgi:hypothetical protein
LGFTESDRRERVEENRRRFFQQLGVRDFTLAPLRQVHSSHSWVVARDRERRLAFQFPGAGVFAPDTRVLQSKIQNHRSKTPKAEPPGGDGLMTAEPGILLTIRVADCLPLLLVDPRRRVVAAVHAGWRGALARVIEKAVGDLRCAFGSDPQRLIAAAGPSIRACCYEVGEEVVDAFHGRFAAAEHFLRPLSAGAKTAGDRASIPFSSAAPPGHARKHAPAAHLDLVAVARDQLTRAGVKPAHILVADYCTACRTDLFFSHRREGARTGRQVAAIGIRGSDDPVIG